MRKGFSLLVAIFTILLLSLVASYIFYASATVAKVGNLQYQQEQARLLARSYTEYAILAIQGHNRELNDDCVETISANIYGDNNNTAQKGVGYQVTVKIYYIGNQKYLRHCSNVITTLSDVDSEDTLMALIDVYVKYKDLLHINKENAPWITYHKRSLQKL